MWLAMITSLYRPIENVVIAAYPFAAFTIALSLLMEGNAQPRQNLAPGIIAHVILSVLSYAILAIAATQSILLAMQNKRLKNHQLSGLFRILPPVQTMEAMLFELIWLGFLFLTD